MFDTINLRLKQHNLDSRANFLEEVPCYLSNVSITEREDGAVWASGYLDNLSVWVTTETLSIRDGSLCKFQLGNNFAILDRQETQRAIEHISDELHQPIVKADVTRIDVASNFIMKYPVNDYLEQLGILTKAKRLLQPNGLYYKQGARQLVFYDKVQEEKKHREPIPELYQNRNVLRYEYRLNKRPKQSLKVTSISANMLSDRTTYGKIVTQWAEKYRAIHKIEQSNIDFSMITSKKELYRWALLSSINSIGGQNEIMKQIEGARRRGDLTPKQAYDIKGAIQQACNVDDKFTFRREVITELDKRVSEAVKAYT